jgi:hypothetical protein
MRWIQSAREDQQNRNRLRREALATRAEFSEALHKRICQAIREAQASPSPAADDVVLRREMRLAWRMAAAAACAITVAVIAWMAFRSNPRPIPSLELREKLESPLANDAKVLGGDREHATMPPVIPVMGDLLASVDQAIAPSQWAYLDHDARVAFRLIAQVLPLKPTAPGTLADAP